MRTQIQNESPSTVTTDDSTFFNASDSDVLEIDYEDSEFETQSETETESDSDYDNETDSSEPINEHVNTEDTSQDSDPEPEMHFDVEPVELSVGNESLISDLESRAESLPNEENAAKPAGEPRRAYQVPQSLTELRALQESPPEAPSTANLNTSRLSEITESLGELTPAQAGRSAAQFNNAVRTAMQNEKAVVDNDLPEIDQPTGLEHGQAAIRQELPPLRERIAEVVQNTDRGNVGAEIPLTPEPQPARAHTSISNPSNESELERAMRSLSISTDVNTSLGDPPEIDLTGEADPNQVEREQLRNGLLVTNSQIDEVNLFRRDFGENDIYPSIPTEKLSSSVELSETTDLSTLETDLTFPVLLESDEALLNEDMLNEIEDERTQVLQQSREASSNFESERALEIERGLENIRNEETLATEEQIRIREENASTIDDYRQAHDAESRQILDDYDREVSSAREEHDSDFDSEIENTMDSAESFFDEAEGEASEREKKAQKRVEEERRKKQREKENRSWLDVAINAVTDFFDALIESVTEIIDDLREGVKALFDAAKAKVVSLIDDARDALIGMVRGFGNMLINLSNIAFAKFPEIRDKFNGFINDSMDEAEERINAAAEDLKNAVIAALDFLAAAVDGLLVAYKTIIVGSLQFFKGLTIAALEMVNAFFEFIINTILQIVSLVAFVAIMQAGSIFLSTAWHLLGDKMKERAVNVFLDVVIGLFEWAPDEFNHGFIWPLFVNMQLGYFYEMYNWDTETKIAFFDKLAGVLISLDFWWNFLLGIFVGIWDNIWGIIEGIWMLIRFIFYDMWVLTARVVEILWDIAPDVIELVEQLNEDIHAFIDELRTTGKEKLKALKENLTRENIEKFFEGLGDDLRVKAQVLGGRLAEQAKDFMMRDDAYATIGWELGKITGYLLVEVLLLFFTAGIGTAIKWGLKGVKVAVKFAKILGSIGKGGKVFSRIIGFFSKGVKWLMRAIQKFAEKVAKLTKGLLERFKTIFSNLSRKIDDIVTKLTGRRPRTRPRPDGPDRPPRQRPRDRDRRNRRREELLWQKFTANVRGSLRRYQRNGITRTQASTLLRRHIVSHRKIAGVSPLGGVDREKGWFKLKAIKKGGIPPIRVPRKVAKVPVIRRERWQLAKTAIKARFSRIRSNQINRAGITRILTPFIKDYKFSRLFPEWDQDETDWNIMGAMSSAKQLHEVKDPEKIYEIFERRVNAKIRTLRNNRRLRNGYARGEVEEQIRAVTHRRGGKDWNKYMEIFRSRRKITVENQGIHHYTIVAKLYKTTNRTRTIGIPIAKLPTGRTRNEAIDMVWFNARYSQIRHLRVRPAFEHNPRFWDSTYRPRQGIFSAQPHQKTTLRVPKSQSTNPNANRAVSGNLTTRIGINANNIITVGRTVQRTPASVKRGSAVRSFRTLIYHYNRDLSGLGYQVDHVRDLGYGGNDNFGNLWPLTATKNQRTSNRMVGQRVHFQMSKRRVIGSPNPPRMFGKWFRIARVQTI